MTHSQPRETDSSSVKSPHVYCEPTQALRVEIEEDGDDTDTHRSWSPVIKPRRRFSTDEILFLQEEFGKDINPSSDYLEMIAEKLGTTRRVITTWFQNHRAKSKRAANSNKNHFHCKRSLSTENMDYHQQRGNDKAGTIDSAQTICMNQSEFEHYPAASYVSDQATSNMYNHHHSIYYTHHNHLPPSTLDSSCTVSDWRSSAWSSVMAPPPSAWPTWPTSYPTVRPENPPYAPVHPNLPQCCLAELYTGSPCPFHSFYSI